MAAVAPGAPGGRAPDAPDGAGDSRGQMVLVGALALAVSLVVLAVVLNSAIYTENLATRSSEVGAGDAADVRTDVRAGAGGIVDYVNRVHAGDDFAALYAGGSSHYATAVDEWRPMAGDHVAVSGRSLAVGDARAMEGTRIADDDAGTDFTPRTAGADALGITYPDTNWLVAGQVEVRRFRMAEVPVGSLTSASPTDPLAATGVFFVEVRDTADGDAWRVAVYENGAGNVEVLVYDVDAATVVGTCSTPASPTTIDFTGASLGGEPCNPLGFLGDVDGLAQVYYVDAEEIRGTYELTVDRAGDDGGDPLKDRVDATNYGDQCSGPSYFDDPPGAGGGNPYAAAAIYSNTLDFEYASQSVTYDTDVRVAPAEPGPAATFPVVTGFTVSDVSGGTDAVFDLSWTTAEPNGDSVAVEVRLRNLVDGTTNTYPVGGGSATITESGDFGDSYRVTLVATDGSNSRAVTETHDVDGDDSGCPP